MFLTKRHVSRRTVLKGACVTLALPLLDAMIPAVTALAKTPAKPVSRLGFVFIPMGCDRSRWTPVDERGVLNELSPILQPLEPVKDQLTVVTNLRLEQSYPGTHDTSNAGFLSAAFARHTESSDYHLGTTVDQVAAKQMGRDRQLPSLELAMDLNPLAGVCNAGARPESTPVNMAIRISNPSTHGFKLASAKRGMPPISSACITLSAM